MRNGFGGKKKLRMLCIPLILALCFSGCGQELPFGLGGFDDWAVAAVQKQDVGEDLFGQVEDPSEVELLDPVLLEETWEAAAYRDLYDTQVITAAVFPEVEEYSFEVNGTLEQFEAYPGDAVQKGTVLVGLNREGIDQSIEDLEKKIQDMEEEFQEYKQDTEESLVEPEGQAKQLEQIVQNLIEMEPEEYVPEVSGGDAAGATGNSAGSDAADATGNSTAVGTSDAADNSETAGASDASSNPSVDGATDASGASGNSDASGSEDAAYEKWLEEYEKWEAEFNRWEGDYRILAHQNDTVRQQLAQRTELYELDHAYQLLQLEKLQKQREQYLLRASSAGEVVAASMIENGDRVAADQKVIAVGDLSHKLLKCEYVDQYTLRGAEEIYAIIHGKRHEIQNVPISSAEYTRLSSKGETIYSTFEIEDDEEVQVGDFAVVVLVKKSRRDVLSVPTDAITPNGLEYYVSRREGEDSVPTVVTIGMNDGVYTEIRSGLEEGDEVLLKEAGPIAPGTGRVTLEKGDFTGSFTGNGFFYYPRTYQVTVPITYGTIYFQEYQVESYQYVHKGDVIATVRVERDDVLLQRTQTRLNRLQERLNDLIQQNKEENADAIEARREEIADVEEELASMNKDFGTQAIVADRDGIVVQLPTHLEEDILRKNDLMAVIAQEDNCYVIVENQGQVLHYGNEVTVSYQDRSGQAVSVPGKVANVSVEGVSKALVSEYAFIRVPGEVAGEMSALSSNVFDWNSWMQFKVEASVREMKDVVLVPKDAVWSWRGKTYVVVADENGQMRAQSFVSGGYDYTYYWVAEGLTEGMVLCLK